MYKNPDFTNNKQTEKVVDSHYRVRQWRVWKSNHIYDGYYSAVFILQGVRGFPGVPGKRGIKQFATGHRENKVSNQK